MVILHFEFWPQEAKKPQKEPQEAFVGAINSVFWMKLNMTLKILALCILSLQSSWHFAFWILWGTKHPLNCLPISKNFGFWFIILQNGTTCKNFGKNVVILHFGFWPQEAKKGVFSSKKYKIQNANYFGMMECKMPKIL